jgi:hypothetical protein
LVLKYYNNYSGNRDCMKHVSLIKWIVNYVNKLFNGKIYAETVMSLLQN